MQTVNFNKLALAFDTTAKISSNERRLQRFFSGHMFCKDSIPKLIFRMVYRGSPLRLAIDRTNWKFGRQDINILMLSVCMDNIAVPLMWTMLDKQGNSNQNERKTLIDRYIKLFWDGVHRKHPVRPRVYRRKVGQAPDRQRSELLHPPSRQHASGRAGQKENYLEKTV